MSGKVLLVRLLRAGLALEGIGPCLSETQTCADMKKAPERSEAKFNSCQPLA